MNSVKGGENCDKGILKDFLITYRKEIAMLLKNWRNRNIGVEAAVEDAEQNRTVAIAKKMLDGDKVENGVMKYVGLMKMLTFISMAVAVFGVIVEANAEEYDGLFGWGFRLTWNNASIRVLDEESAIEAEGGSGIEAGAVGKYSVFSKILAVGAEANLGYRNPVKYDKFKSSELAIGTPIYIEVNPIVIFYPDYYENTDDNWGMFFMFGIQPDLTLFYGDNYKKLHSSGSNIPDREKFDYSIFGGGSMFIGRIALDLRIMYGHTKFYKSIDPMYNYLSNGTLFQMNLSLRYYIRKGRI
jgi:hypothetical protein